MAKKQSSKARPTPWRRILAVGKALAPFLQLLLVLATVVALILSIYQSRDTSAIKKTLESEVKKTLTEMRSELSTRLRELLSVNYLPDFESVMEALADATTQYRSRYVSGSAEPIYFVTDVVSYGHFSYFQWHLHYLDFIYDARMKVHLVADSPSRLLDNTKRQFQSVLVSSGSVPRSRALVRQLVGTSRKCWRRRRSGQNGGRVVPAPCPARRAGCWRATARVGRLAASPRSAVRSSRPRRSTLIWCSAENARRAPISRGREAGRSRAMIREPGPHLGRCLGPEP